MNIIRGLAIGRIRTPLAGHSARHPALRAANPAKWDNEEWLDLLPEAGLSDDRLVMHRKPYEFTQLRCGCRRLGMLRDDASFLSGRWARARACIGSPTTCAAWSQPTYEGVWQDERAREAIGRSRKPGAIRTVSTVATTRIHANRTADRQSFLTKLSTSATRCRPSNISEVRGSRKRCVRWRAC
jgi:hypothetical protein